MVWVVAAWRGRVPLTGAVGLKVDGGVEYVGPNPSGDSRERLIVDAGREFAVHQDLVSLA
jgi:hypothetical protein